MTEKVLLILLKRIGDVLMTTAAVEMFKQQQPDAEIHVLTQSPAHLIYLDNPHITEVTCYPKAGIIKQLKAIGSLRTQGYTAVIDFQGSPQTALIGWLAGIKTRIGFKLRGREHLYTHRIRHREHIHYSAHQRACLLAPLGVELDPSVSIRFYTNAQDQASMQGQLRQLKINPHRPLITVSPVSRQAYKVWPAERFAQICDWLITQHNAQILFLWGPKEEVFIEAVRLNMKEQDLGDYPIPSISESAALQSMADLHLGNDNGPRHFSIAQGVPTVTIFGRPLAKNWTPPYQPKHIILEHDPGCKHHCTYPNCHLECLTGTEVKTVQLALEKALKQIQATKQE